MMELWPFTNFHDLNLDWIIRKIKNVETSEANAKASEEAAKASEEAAKASEEAAAESARESASYVELYITPEMYGAVGNGVTDDTVALQDAINAAANDKKVLRLKGKTYVVTEPLYLVPGVTIIGPGSHNCVIQKYTDTAPGGSVTINSKVYSYTTPTILYHKPTNESDTCDHVTLKGVTLKGGRSLSDRHNRGLMGVCMPYMVIEDVRLLYCAVTEATSYAFELGYSWVCDLKDLVILGESARSMKATDCISLNMYNTQSRAGTLRMINTIASLTGPAFDNGGPSFEILQGSKVTMVSPDCETYGMPIMCDQSYLAIQGGRFELHSPDGIAEPDTWIQAVSNSKVTVDGTHIEYATYHGGDPAALKTVETSSIITGNWSMNRPESMETNTAGYIQNAETRISKEPGISNKYHFGTLADADLTFTTSYRKGRKVKVFAYAQGYGDSYMISGDLLINRNSGPAVATVNNVTVSGQADNTTPPTFNVNITGDNVNISITGTNMQDCYGTFEY